MLKKIFDAIRAFLFVVLTLGLLSLGVLRLMRLQVVEGDEFHDEAISTSQIEQIISSPRGEIVDVNGTSLVSNKVGYNVILEKIFAPSDQTELDRVILEITHILAENDTGWIESLPITKEAPYEFLPDRDSDIAKMRTAIRVQPYATAADCIDAMAQIYKIPEDYTEREKRDVSGVRYEMELRSFSNTNIYTFAEDIPLTAVISLKEASYRLEGMDVVADDIRFFNVDNIMPHFIGVVGMISPEEYNQGKDSGYLLSDVYGKTGIELAMESELRGEKGIRTIGMYNGAVISDEITTPAIPGHTVKLTFDIDYAEKLQQILESHINWLNNQTDPDRKGYEATAGALVVSDAKTGALLGAANYPTYDLTTYKTDYASLNSDPAAPLLNRVTTGLYRPGSTFKTVTSAAALNEGYIDLNTHIACNNVYKYWSDYQPKCTGWHGRINVVTALEKSCNIFYYEIGRIMGIDTIMQYADEFGFGARTGIEVLDFPGQLATPATLQKSNQEWQAGLVVQAAIGQSETYVTPLQMNVLATTLANDGKRLRPYLTDSIYSYNMETLIEKTEPEVLYTIEDKSGITFSSIKQGMIKAAQFVPYSYPTEDEYFSDYLLTSLPEKAALKTGTPQMNTAVDTGSAFIGYYPADDPVIAFSGFVEHGEWSKLMIKQIIEAYLYENYQVTKVSRVFTPESILAGLQGSE